jgi:hypothetical protein
MKSSAAQSSLQTGFLSTPACNRGGGRRGAQPIGAQVWNSQSETGIPKPNINNEK